MIIIVVVCTFLGLAIALGVNWVMWFSGKKRLDVMTYFYIQLAMLWYFVPLVVGLLISIAELTANPRKRWRDTWGGRIAVGSLALFVGGWVSSLLSGLVLKYLFSWAEGPTVPEQPKKP